MGRSKTTSDSTRTVRFKQSELSQIDEFLNKNPFFDFSTLTRVAIQRFITDPDLKLVPVEPHKQLGEKNKTEPEVKH